VAIKPGNCTLLMEQISFKGTYLRRNSLHQIACSPGGSRVISIWKHINIPSSPYVAPDFELYAIIPVSYTHLDVYKRQLSLRINRESVRFPMWTIRRTVRSMQSFSPGMFGSPLPGIRSRNKPVSYTHLPTPRCSSRMDRGAHYHRHLQFRLYRQYGLCSISSLPCNS